MTFSSFSLQTSKKWKFRTFRTLAKSGQVVTPFDRLDTVNLSRAKVGTRFCTFEKWNFRNFRNFHGIYINFSAEVVFSSSKITDGADRSRPFKNKANSRGNCSQNPLFVKEVTFSQKSEIYGNFHKIIKEYSFHET